MVYKNLKNVKEEDFFYRFKYIATEQRFKNVLVEVYCKCEMPYNPDLLMVQCDECKDWFHPACIDMKIADIKKLKHFLCPDCSFDRAATRSMNLNWSAVVSATKAKVGSKRRKVGNVELFRSDELNHRPPHVGRVESLECDKNNNVTVKVSVGI
ncbi:chromatin remodeling protein EBS [Tanacetum coccineum]